MSRSNRTSQKPFSGQIFIKKQVGNRKAGPRRSQMIPHPPKISNFEITHSVQLRFITNAVVAQNITFQNLLDLILFTTSAVAPFDLFFAVRVGQIKIWSDPIGNTTSTVTLIYDGAAVGFVGDFRTITDTSMGIEPAYISAGPSGQSLASRFQVSSAANAFALNVPANTVIDVQLNYRSSTAGNAVAAQNASVGAIVGAVAFRGLDGLPLATSKFTLPTGLNQI